MTFLRPLLLRLDEREWPQRLVRWVIQQRKRSRLTSYLAPSSSGVVAVTLTVATPLISRQDLFDRVVPSSFGVWREFKVKSTCHYGDIATAMLQDPRNGTEFALVIPIHADLKLRRFKAAKRIRLCCEAERARLVSVREPSGLLLAAGTLELSQRAAFSRELK